MAVRTPLNITTCLSLMIDLQEQDGHYPAIQAQSGAANA
jgi:hypothetical protein